MSVFFYEPLYHFDRLLDEAFASRRGGQGNQGLQRSINGPGEGAVEYFKPRCASIPVLLCSKHPYLIIIEWTSTKTPRRTSSPPLSSSLGSSKRTSTLTFTETASPSLPNQNGQRNTMNTGLQSARGTLASFLVLFSYPSESRYVFLFFDSTKDRSGTD